MALNCTDINGLGVTQFVFNDDGTVSGIVSNGDGNIDQNSNRTRTTYVSAGEAVSSQFQSNADTFQSPISEECCRALNFTWDNSTNKCYWTQTCDQEPDFKIVLGAKGNDGAWFQIDENETCHLEVEFDYLFQFDCDTLRDCLREQQVQNLEGSDINNQIDTKNAEIKDIENTILELQAELDRTKKECEARQTENNNTLSSLQKTHDVTYREILNTQDMLSNARTDEEKATFQASLDRLMMQYEREAAEIEHQRNLSLSQANECESIITRLDETIREYQIKLEMCQQELRKLQSNVESQVDSESDPRQTNQNVPNCLSPFENLDVCVTLDKIVQRESNGDISYQSTQTLEQVFEEQLFKVDDIVEYWRNNCNTGLYVTGDSKCLEQLKQCVIYNLSGNCGVFSACTLNSDWLHHKFTITDLETLSGLTNEKIKLGFKIKNFECNFCLLIDRIEINKVCTTLDKESIYITRCPSFELERVCDNKKSWVAEEETTHREFELSMRETDYKINHHKLAINTKEVDLNISPANAIETDVWCYLTDNEALLDCSTGTTSVTLNTDHDFEAILTAYTNSCDNGYSSACVTSVWSLDVELECRKIYSTPFFSGTTISGAPSQEDYVLALSGIAQNLGLEITTGTTEVIFTSNVDCSGTTFINKSFKVDLCLDITTDCYKQFQDNDLFEFQDGTPYDFQ